MNKLLVVEDDARLNHAVCKYLAEAGYNVTAALDVNEAFEAMEHATFDLIISDIMMPEIDGFEFVETIRQTDTSIPVLFMTAKEDMPSKSRAYRIGIDDYMVKPINLEELALRIGALFRRVGANNSRVLKIGNFVMNMDELTVTWNGEDIPVTAREFNILFKMLSNPKKAFSRSLLKDEFWNADSDATLRAVDMYIVKLRNKFEHCPEFKIVTVYGVGYKAVIE